MTRSQSTPVSSQVITLEKLLQQKEDELECLQLQVNALKEYSDDQWWFQELLRAAEARGAPDDLKRAVVGVTRSLLIAIRDIKVDSRIVVERDVSVLREAADVCLSRVEDDEEDPLDDYDTGWTSATIGCANAILDLAKSKLENLSER